MHDTSFQQIYTLKPPVQWNPSFLQNLSIDLYVFVDGDGCPAAAARIDLLVYSVSVRRAARIELLVYSVHGTMVERAVILHVRT
mmetsp:Transcript_6469/g.12552  ORF Transcript_6469/g.12552 Transcript_6469/m.12552 type:complete len:84 (+) Transcript_6469:1071-1322(+)